MKKKAKAKQPHVYAVEDFLPDATEPANDSRLKNSIRHFERSAALGARLRWVRTELNLSQEEVARRIIITRERLANYEDGRTPLKLRVGLRFCDSLVVSEKWLATGIGPFRQCMDLFNDPTAKKLSDDASFSDAYEQILSARYEQLLAANPHRIRFSEAGENPSSSGGLFNCFLKSWLPFITQPATNGLIEHLLQVGNEYCAQHCDGALSEPDILMLLEESGLPAPEKLILAAHRRAHAKRQRTQGA